MPRARGVAAAAIWRAPLSTRMQSDGPGARCSTAYFASGPRLPCCGLSMTLYGRMWVARWLTVVAEHAPPACRSRWRISRLCCDGMKVVAEDGAQSGAYSIHECDVVCRIEPTHPPTEWCNVVTPEGEGGGACVSVTGDVDLRVPWPLTETCEILCRATSLLVALDWDTAHPGVVREVELGHVGPIRTTAYSR